MECVAEFVKCHSPKEFPGEMQVLEMERQDVAAAVGCLASLLCRCWGLSALCEKDCLKRNRLLSVGRGAAAAV